MSILGERNYRIKEGDIVFLYETIGKITKAKMKKGEVIQNNLGSFKHDDMIGQVYGSKIVSNHKKGWLYVLHPSPEMWVNTLTYRTQILYEMDISNIIYRLDIVPGSIVFESGTGSGSLSTAIARTLAPSGHLHTFEFNLDRVTAAREDFELLGMNHVITVHHRNVVKDGFPEDLLKNSDNSNSSNNKNRYVDAVFLDLPNPWSVIENINNVLKVNGGLCSFSPCIEQVHRTVEQMAKFGFSEIQTIETLIRPWTTYVDKTTKADFSSLDIPTWKDKNDHSNEPPKKKAKVTRWEQHAYTRPGVNMRGHTGYLTFAVRSNIPHKL